MKAASLHIAVMRGISYPGELVSIVLAGYPFYRLLF